jgi:hypothetical protein
MWGRIIGSVGGTFESFEAFREWDIGNVKFSWKGM